EGERAGLALIVVIRGRSRSRSRAVGGREVDGHRLVAGTGKSDREDELARSGTTLDDRHIRDADLRKVIIEDGCQALAVRDDRVRRVAEIDYEGLIGLVQRVAVDRDADSLADLAGSEIQPAGLILVIAAGRGGAVGRRVIDRYPTTARR